MTDDLISRQAAIDLFPNDVLEWDTFYGYIAPHVARRLIEDLPSAQRTGKWKRIPSSYRALFECSECGEKTTTTVMGKPRYEYCPMCGARMVEE